MKQVPAFLWILILYLPALIDKKLGVPGFPALVRNHWADFLFIPFLLSVSGYLFRRLKIKGSITPLHGLICLLWASWFFEWWLPSRDVRFTADPADVLAYVAGCVVYTGFYRWGTSISRISASLRASISKRLVSHTPSPSRELSSWPATDASPEIMNK